MKCILDTNVLLNDIDLEEYEMIYVPMTVLEELDKLKLSDNPERAFNSRNAMRKLIALKDKVKYIINRQDCCLIENTPDNRIISTAFYIQNELDKDAEMISQDFNVIEKCRAIGIKFKNIQECVEKDFYKGYKQVYLDEHEIAYFYENLEMNIYDLLINEYLIIYDKNEKFISATKWNGERYTNLSYKKMNNHDYIEQISPKDEIQQCAFDALFNSNVICMTGKQGTGKTLLALGTALTLLKNERCRKIWIVASNVPLKGAFDIGFRSGDTITKNLQLQIGNILSTKMGGDEAILSLIATDQMGIINLIDIRGVEFGEDDVVIVTESQNLSTYHMKTILSRCKNGCKIICEGDILDQRDVRNDCGLLRVIETFKGNKMFSTIKLRTNYRSEFAELLDKL